jgi:hypothetical protein
MIHIKDHMHLHIPSMATVSALTVKITHKIGNDKEGFTVNVSLEQTQSLFDVLVSKIAAPQYWTFLEMKQNKITSIGWRDWRPDVGYANSAPQFKSHLDEYIQKVFMVPEPPILELCLRHTDTKRFFVCRQQ